MADCKDRLLGFGHGDVVWGLEDTSAAASLAAGATTAELGHLLRQHGEDVGLLDAVMHLEALDELQASVNEGMQRHAGRPAARRAGAPEHVPRRAEVVVEQVHVLG